MSTFIIKNHSLLFLSAALAVAPVLATSANIGCSNCLGGSKDDIRYGCYQLCAQAFNPSTSEYTECRSGCNAFVFDDDCCYGSCSSDPNQCMNTFFPPAMFNSRRREVSPSEEREHARGFKPLTDDPTTLQMSSSLTLLDDTDEDGKTLLEARIDYGQTCCVIADSVLAIGTPQLAFYVRAQTWDEHSVAGLIMVAFGLSSSYACKAVWETQCTFGLQNFIGALAGGPLPPVGFAPPAPRPVGK